MMKAHKTDLPEESWTRTILPADYTDAFRCEVPGTAAFFPDELQVVFWTRMPGWINVLMKLRNTLVKPLGLQSGEGPMDLFARAIRSGEPYGLMSVPFKSDRETVVKLNDKHLVAYMSVFVESHPHYTAVTAATVVQYHNRLGRAYFFVIRPFHKIIVRSLLKNIIQQEL